MTFLKKSWIILRRKMIVNILLESFILICFYYFHFDQLIKIKIFFILITWVILSYLTGRYHKLIYGNPNYSRYFQKYITSLTFLLLILKFSHEFLFNINYFLWIIFYCFLSSNILFLTRRFIYKFTKTNDSWGFIGSKNTLDKIQAYDDFKEKNYKINLIKKKELLLNNNQHNKNKKIIYEFNSVKNSDLKQLKKDGFNSLSLLDWHDLYLNRFPSFLINKRFISISNKNSDRTFYIIFKKLLDIVLSIIILLISSPLIIFICLLVFIEDGHNPFYTQIRTGINRKKIKIVKIRSMKKNAENNGAVWSTKKDRRITNIGKIIRKSRIDELPQLLSVIKGDMSLIGPRPERPELDNILSKEIKNYNLRYCVKPGLSGWAQVNYPYGASVKDAEYKLSYDLYYQNKQSVLLDLLIIIKTIKLVINQEGAISKF